MRSCVPDVKIYRIQLVVPCVGVVGLMFLSYVSLYGVGIIDWRMFPKVDDFRPVDRHDLGRVALPKHPTSPMRRANGWQGPRLRGHVG